MQALAVADPRIRLLDNLSNLGFGGSYKRGARAATATYVMMLPGDDGFPAQSIAEIVSHAGEADIIIPIVANPGERSCFRAFASKGLPCSILNSWLGSAAQGVNVPSVIGYFGGHLIQSIQQFIRPI
jgi:hypothetical protein